jgi:hypothetical protein
VPRDVTMVAEDEDVLLAYDPAPDGDFALIFKTAADFGVSPIRGAARRLFHVPLRETDSGGKGTSTHGHGLGARKPTFSGPSNWTPERPNEQACKACGHKHSRWVD